MAEQMVREYPDIPARVIGEADPEAATAIWQAVFDWHPKFAMQDDELLESQATGHKEKASNQ